MENRLVRLVWLVWLVWLVSGPDQWLRQRLACQLVDYHRDGPRSRPVVKTTTLGDKSATGVECGTMQRMNVRGATDKSPC